MRERNSFKTPLVVEVQPDGKTFKVVREFTYLWQSRNGIAIPIHINNFKTDFASIPRVCRLLIPKLGRYTKAAVVHDYLYQTPMIKAFTSPHPRRFADLVFRDGMKELGVAPWKYSIMFAVVRLFGWLAWRKR